jgi:hypothetical protein
MQAAYVTLRVSWATGCWEYFNLAGERSVLPVEQAIAAARARCHSHVFVFQLWYVHTGWSDHEAVIPHIKDCQSMYIQYARGHLQDASTGAGLGELWLVHPQNQDEGRV